MMLLMPLPEDIQAHGNSFVIYFADKIIFIHHSLGAMVWLTFRMVLEQILLLPR